MNHGSLFSGIGGFDLAADWMGWENVFHCEIGEFGQRILKHYWPSAISYENIKTTDFSVHRGIIDILTGGFPCQPYSIAGKRKGDADDRHLWPEMLRAIREISPRWIVGENVRGLTNWNGGLVFDQVQADMETEGYEIIPFLFPACAINAPHRRDRIWFIAYAIGNDAGGCGYGEIGCQKGVMQSEEKERKWIWPIVERISPERSSPNAKSEGLEGKDRIRVEGAIQPSECIVTDPECSRSSGKEYGQKKSGFNTKKDQGQWWADFPTQSPIRSRDDGFPGKLDGITFPKWRNESIKSYGNAIVPQAALQIFKAIEQYDQLKTNTNVR